MTDDEWALLLPYAEALADARDALAMVDEQADPVLHIRRMTELDIAKAAYTDAVSAMFFDYADDDDDSDDETTH